MTRSLDELRTLATEMLACGHKKIDVSKIGTSVKELIEELSIYQIELEHQNAELERSEKQISLLNAEYIDLFESAPISFVVIDQNRTILRANQLFIEGFVPIPDRTQSIEGRAFDEFICPEYQNAFYLFIKMMQKKNRPMSLELKLMDKFSAPHYVMITVGMTKTSPTRCRLAINDIVMQKRLEAQLMREKDKAIAADHQKSLFLTNASYELRTPLATIIGYGDMLRNTQTSMAVKTEYVEAMTTAAKMLYNLTDTVLDLSVLESGIVSTNPSLTDVASCCREMTRMVQRTIRNKNVLIALDIAKMPMLMLNSLRLQQILHMILEHAATNAESGTIALAVNFAMLNSTKGTLILSLTGENIFSGEVDVQNTFTVGAHFQRRIPGLGLFMLKRVVESVEGQLFWEHPLNALRIEMPVEIAVRADPVPEDDEIEIKPPPKAPDAPKTCLLVDDIVMNLKVLAAMMKEKKFVPTMATSGKEALELLAHNHFDIIMTDLWMPEMNGEELAIMIRQNPQYDDIPIYAVTADIERKTNFDMEFFADTIIKPVNMEKIENVLASTPLPPPIEKTQSK